MAIRFGMLVVSFFVMSVSAMAHDTWVETNTSVVRLGHVVHVDLKLGNHGNEHRDFKLASKISLDASEIKIQKPHDPSLLDLKARMTDAGLLPKEGYWTARYVPDREGLHTVIHSARSQHGKTLGFKSAKSYFVVSKTLDHLDIDQTGFDKPVGHPLELIPLDNPVTSLKSGQPLRVQVLFESRPLTDARVSFIPRGTQLAEGFDAQYEQKTDSQGTATLTPRESNIYLIVVHHKAPDRKGPGFDETSYSATLTVHVMQ